MMSGPGFKFFWTASCEVRRREAGDINATWYKTAAIKLHMSPLSRRVFRFLRDVHDWIAVRAHSCWSLSRGHVVLDLSQPSFF